MMKPANGQTMALIIVLVVSSLAIALVSGQSGTFAPFEGGRFGSANRFAFEPPEGFAPPPLSAPADSGANSTDLSWRLLRATFRPLNRPAAPTAPVAPTAPQPPSLPESLALVGDEPVDRDNAEISAINNNNNNIRSLGARLESIFSSGAALPTTSASTTPLPIDLDDDQPTRVPMSRFRPTAAPSDDREPAPVASLSGNVAGETASRSADPTASSASQPEGGQPLARSSHQAAALLAANNNNRTSTQLASSGYEISNECFECICEASTSCNAQSRCQTSDVRRTRCGLFLISYSQWLESGLSRQLVSAEALSRDVAADERAFYECVTNRDCGQQLLIAYMGKRARDCDRDGRIDCYDIAAIHQGGVEQCNSETLLESQYWSDFNACYGFAARR